MVSRNRRNPTSNNLVNCHAGRIAVLNSQGVSSEANVQGYKTMIDMVRVQMIPLISTSISWPLLFERFSQ